jgi:CheY-like chemotaxis protein
MSSIALFPCTFTGGAGIIGELSINLDLRVYTDANLFSDTVAVFGGSVEKLKKLMYSKTSVFNQFTLEKEAAVSMFRKILSERLQEHGHYLFYGLHTSLIPPNVTEVLRVLVVDKKKPRAARGEKDGLTPREIKKRIKSHDVSAFAWTDFLFGKEAYDPSLYDLVLPVEGRDHRAITEEILKFFHKTSVLRTKESQVAVKNLKTRAEVELALLKKGHNLPVTADGGKITITVENSVFNFGGLQKELTELAGEVAGVEEVELKKSKTYAENVYRQQKFDLPSKVLFVDDEREFVQTVSQRLISRDVGTYGVYNGEEALEIINEDRPEVMVLDLKMPGLHGLEVLRRTKEIAPEVEVIILTGHGTVKDEHECMELGAFAYLNKPVDIEQLSATIKEANDKIHKKAA